jgi:hypothetical protein
MIYAFCQRVQVSVGNQWINSEYIFPIETLSELPIIGEPYVILTEIHFQDVILFITICFY